MKSQRHPLQRQLLQQLRRQLLPWLLSHRLHQNQVQQTRSQCLEAFRLVRRQPRP